MGVGFEPGSLCFEVRRLVRSAIVLDLQSQGMIIIARNESKDYYGTFYQLVFSYFLSRS